MTEIPEDVKRAAEAASTGEPWVTDIAARAILAERKRCADVARAARNDAEFYGNPDMMRVATLIKHRIEATQ